jgi:hypothetical protein
MSERTKKETSLLVFCCVIAIGSVIAFQTSLILLFLIGFAWITLTFALIVIFIGAVYGIFKLSFGRRALDTELVKEPTRKNLIWILTAIVSGAGAIISLVFGYLEIIDLSSFPTIVSVNILGAFLVTLFLLSLMVLISRMRQSQKENAISETTKDV